MLQPDSMFPDAYNPMLKEVLLACDDDRMDLAGRCVPSPERKSSQSVCGLIKEVGSC